MSKWIDYIKLFWYFGANWNFRLAWFIIVHEIRGEKKYHINTTAPIELPDLTIQKGDITKSSRYEAVNYFILESLLQKMRTIDEVSSFSDLGCGKGRALVVAAHFGFTKLKGVDFAREVCDEARNNMRCLKEVFPAISYEIICGNVTDYTVQPWESVFFMFNPFDKEIIEILLEKVEDSLGSFPRTIYFLYASPRHIETFFEFEYEPVYRKRKLKWLDGVILKKEAVV
ncbi:MAG: class I SAM-dependent methyltransferase [Chitinophagaceae bacterium]|nr:class I SAM-dependent methyltransferase [Chitinophagaceae bacterium]